MKLLTSCVSLNLSFLLLAVLVALGSPIGRKEKKTQQKIINSGNAMHYRIYLEFSTKEGVLLPRKWETLSHDQTSSGHLE